MASLERTYRQMVEQRKITDATDLEDKDKDELKDISKALNKSTKAHAKQAKYLDKLVKKDKDTNEGIKTPGDSHYNKEKAKELARKDGKDPERLSYGELQKYIRQAEKMNEENNLEEGTWHMPDSPKDMKKIISILGKPLPVGDEENAYEGSEAEVGRKLNALGKAKVPIGDDRFYDEAYELSTKKGPRADLRPVIIDALVRFGMLDKKGTPAAVISALNMAMKKAMKREEVNEAVNKSKRRAIDKKMFKKLVLNMGEEQVDEIAPAVANIARVAGTAAAASAGDTAGKNIANKLTANKHKNKEMDDKFAKLSPQAQSHANLLMRQGAESGDAIARAKRKFDEQIEGDVEQVQTEPATNKSLFTGYINKLIKGEV
jgi:hypothetical protein